MPPDLQATAAVRRRMQRTARKDNGFERAVRSLLHVRALRFRIHYLLPGLKRTTCDVAFPGLKIAVFLDGCFWHGCEQHPPSVKKNTEFWLQKIEHNRARDARATAHLTELGWTVLRFWEHETVEAIVEVIASTVTELKAASSFHSRPSTLQNVEWASGQLEAIDGNVASIEALSLK
ncbi:very short patch repair endonuclease [Rhizobium sp. UPM1132]|uniref:very short patch repair endonuclease n=1 Tax=Rhizobium ruizarguesonis TaxID=2081791 RepID=UPI00144716C2|nr:very short patch repair endonuclease [Rhizobium ruizarguesonis]NKQ73432.1 very short patch repair endonuclease [Rhizobium ruizarguesonis]